MRPLVTSPHRFLARTLLLAALMLVTSACGTGSSDSGESATTAAETDAPTDESSTDGTTAGGPQQVASELDAKSFVATAIGGGPQIVAGSEIMLSFIDGHLTVYAGCNTMVGQVSLAGGTLSAGPLATTMMACEQPLMNQDAWLAAFLESGPAWTLEGIVLKLEKDAQSLTLEAL